MEHIARMSKTKLTVVAWTARLKTDLFGGLQIFLEPSWQHKFGTQSNVRLHGRANISIIDGGAGWHCTNPTKVFRAEIREVKYYKRCVRFFELKILIRYCLLSMFSGNGSSDQIGAAVRQYNSLSFLSGQQIRFKPSQSSSFEQRFTGNLSGNVYDGHLRRIPKISGKRKCSIWNTYFRSQ